MQPNRPAIGTHDNVYFLFVDAAGHSSIVSDNPRDRAAEAFDLVRTRTAARLAKVADAHRCNVARVWQWAGDGGMLMIHDERESIAAATAIDVGRSLVELDLRHLRDEFSQLGIRGELRLRVSAHKGTLQYRGPEHDGALYGSAINLAAHLEKATPPDTFAITGEVHRMASDPDRFRHVDTFEGAEVFLTAADGSDVARSWLAQHGLAAGTRVHAYPERPSQHEKARLIDSAQEDVIDLGSALNTCANYLVTTERPARFRQAVLDFLARGGTYRCIAVDPDAPSTALAGQQLAEDLPAKIRTSLEKFRQFRVGGHPGIERLEVYLADVYSPMAALTVDLHQPQALVLYSPYLFPIGPGVGRRQRADMPHYLLDRSAGGLFDTVAEVVQAMTKGRLTRAL